MNTRIFHASGSVKRFIGCFMAVSGLMLAGAEGPDLAVQIAVNIFGLILFAVPAMIAIRSQKKENR